MALPLVGAMTLPHSGRCGSRPQCAECHSPLRKNKVLEVVAGGIALQEGEYTLRLVAADEAASGSLPRGDGVVVLDVTVTPELAAEGLARDLVRQVQQARKDAGLEVSDRIALTIGGSDEVVAAARTHEALITSETLATSFALVTSDASEPVVTVTKQ